MNYDLKISIEELSLLKAALFDYHQWLEKSIISAKYFEENIEKEEVKDDIRRSILSKKETINEVICLMGKLQNIIPVAKKLTEEN